MLKELVEKLMEEFIHENPYGDSSELAEFMFLKGAEYAKKEILGM